MIFIVDTLDIITEAFDEGYDTVNSSVTTILSSNIEKLVLTGNYSTSGGGNALDNHIIGNSNNLLSGGLGLILRKVVAERYICDRECWR